MFSFQNAWPIKRKAVYTLVHFHIFIHYLDQIGSQLAYFLKQLIYYSKPSALASQSAPDKVSYPRPHVSVFVWNQRFIFSIWPIVHTYSIETVTKNASFKKRSPEGRVLKTPYSFEWMKTEVLFEKDYVELLDTRECERSQRGFFGKEEKLSVFQNYPATCGLYRHNKCASSTESIILIAPGAEAAFQVRKRIWTNTKRKFVVAMWSNVREFFWIY